MRTWGWVVIVGLTSCSGGQVVDGGAEDAGAPGSDAGVAGDAGPSCPWGRLAPGDRPLFPWLESLGDAGVADGGSRCVPGSANSLTCSGLAHVESADAGPVLRFDDGSRLEWSDARAAGLQPPQLTGALVDVSLTRASRAANPFGPVVETITARLVEPATGRVLWLSRGGYDVGLALTDAEAMELFGQAPTYRDLCTSQFDHTVCWKVSRTFSEVEVGGVVLQPNELGAVGDYQLRWTQSADVSARPPTCSGDDSADPTPDCSFSASYRP